MRIVYETFEEWKQEGIKRFGKDINDWVFKCPMCGREYSVKEFVEAGGEPDGAYCECIGRYLGAGSPSKKNKGKGCNWCSYGLFGIPDKCDATYIKDKNALIYSFGEAK